MNRRATNLLLVAVVSVPLMLVACSLAPNPPPTTPTVRHSATSLSPSPPDSLQPTPYPYTTPLPPAQPTILDGTYTKLDPRQAKSTPLPEGRVWMPHPVREGVYWAKPVPYPLVGGEWTLQLDKGIFRVYHENTGWRTFGSFTVSDDQVQFFNDPQCVNAVGTYRWTFEAHELILEAVADKCDGRVLGGGGLRVDNFTELPWTLTNPSTDD